VVAGRPILVGAALGVLVVTAVAGRGSLRHLHKIADALSVLRIMIGAALVVNLN
jgi:hypothetical protein